LVVVVAIFVSEDCKHAKHYMIDWLKKGKSPMLALIAAVNKLLKQIMRISKSAKPYDEKH